MSLFYFVTDLHGKVDRYEKLFGKIIEEKPSAVFLGGDLLPSGLRSILNGPLVSDKFLDDFIFRNLFLIKNKLSEKYPRIFVILGNDDPASVEKNILEGERMGLWEYVHNKKKSIGDYAVYGYSCVPPTPFLLKDWERYDLSQYVDPASVPPEDGFHSIPFKRDDIFINTIQVELEGLIGNDDLSKSIFLFHSPPYRTKIDRAALDDLQFKHVPLDVNIGSIAIRNFIERKQPLITLHGHVHESTRLTGSWSEMINNTFICNAAHDGPELALIRFDPGNLMNAYRTLI